MHQFNQRPPYLSILFLLLVGAAATATAFWLVDHPQVVPNSGLMIAVLVGLFLGSYIWAFLRHLGWRDNGRAMMPSTSSQPDPALEGTVYGMMPGREYQVVQSFMDYYGNLFEQGERPRFKQRHFLPYHAGHTILFEERALYLQEDQNKEILDHFSDYIVLIDESMIGAGNSRSLDRCFLE